MRSKHTIRLLYLLTLVLVVLLWRAPFAAFAALSVTSILLLNATAWKYTGVYVVCAVLGSLSEVVAIRMGVWTYANPQLAGIPVWLPLVWGSASILFVQLAQQFGGIEVVKKPRKRRKK